MSYLSIALANLRHKPIRTALTGACLVMAFLLFGLLRPIELVFSEGPNLNNIGRLIVTPKHSTSDMLPVRHASQIEALDGVQAVSHFTWFGGQFKDTANSFPQYAVERTSFLQVAPELEFLAGDAQSFLNNHRAAIIGADLAARYGWQPGDRVPLVPTIWHNRDGSAWEFEIAGIYQAAQNSLLTSDALYFGYSYFDEYRAFGNGKIGSVLLLAEQPTAAARLATEIDTLFENSSAETTSLTDREYALSFARQLANVGPAILAVLGAVFFTIGILTANSIAQSIRERRTQIAVLGVLGFSSTTVLLLAVFETLLLCLVAAAVGLACAQILLNNLPAAVPEMAQFGRIAVTADVILIALLIAAALGLIAVLPPAIKTLRTPLPDALRV